MKNFIQIISFSILMFCQLAQAEIDPLKLYIRTDYPPTLTTVDEGARWLLEATGYRLVLSHPAPQDAQTLASQRITPMANMKRTMTIEDALLTLIGPENYLVVDRKNKLVSFTKLGE